MLSQFSNFPICLAPMVGISHVAVRESLRYYMPQGARMIWPTGMLSSFKLPREDLESVSGGCRRQKSSVDLVQSQ